MTNILNNLKLSFKNAYYDFHCGKHSNFPLCCNLCYSIGDNLSCLHKYRYYRYRRYFNWMVERLRHKNFGYIPCPACVCVREPVEVAKCSCFKQNKISSVRSKLAKKHIKLNSLLAKYHIKINKIMDIFLDEPESNNYF